MSAQDPQLNSFIDWILSAPDTDEQNCDSTDWFTEMYDWAEQVTNDTGCPPDTSHVFGCDRCYNWFDYLIRDMEWQHTPDGMQYLREQHHWSWHDLIERGVPFQPRTDILQEGDRNWMVIGRQPRPDSAPVP